jgi:polyadenylate-binding protein
LFFEVYTFLSKSLQAALAGSLNIPMRYEELSALSPVVRKEVISGELQRRIKTLDTVPAEDIDQIVETISALSLSDVVATIQDPKRLVSQVQHATTSLNIAKTMSSRKSPSPQTSQDSRLLDVPNTTASLPDRPTTPISMPASLSTPPRTESPSGSVPPPSERDRMAAAISKLESTQASELTELLMSLPKRERAMCLFNAEVLRAKIADAKMVLNADDEPEEQAPPPAPPAIEAPTTPQKRVVSTVAVSPQTPALSSRGPSAAASPAPTTPSALGATYTIESLARLPASEIVRLATGPKADSLPIAKADPLVVKATDEFIDGLLDKPIQQQKQALGDKLYVYRAPGIDNVAHSFNF